MSLSKDIEINCPKCKEKQNFKIWQSVNVTEDPGLKEKVFSGEIFKFTCGNCKTESFMEYPFIYHDYERRFFVYFDPSGKFENIIESQGYKTKTASNYLEFAETVKILEDMADENKIREAEAELLAKFKANDKLKSIDKLYYSGIKNNKIEFFVPEINGKISV